MYSLHALLWSNYDFNTLSCLVILLVYWTKYWDWLCYSWCIHVHCFGLIACICSSSLPLPAFFFLVFQMVPACLLAFVIPVEVDDTILIKKRLFVILTMLIFTGACIASFKRYCCTLNSILNYNWTIKIIELYCFSKNWGGLVHALLLIRTLQPHN